MKPHELDILIEDCLEGWLSEADAARLSAELQASPEARSRYWESASIHGLLEHTLQQASLQAITGQASPKVTRWFIRRPLIAAAAGLVFGMLCTSMVFGFSRLASTTAGLTLEPAVTLLDDGFESGDAEFQAGFPSKAGAWSGGVVHVVGERDGIAPIEGGHMLRLEPDESINERHIDRVFDLSGLPLPADGGTRHVEVTAWFHASEAGLRSRYTLRAAAFAETPDTLRDLGANISWQELESQALATAKRGTTTDMEGWQKLTIRVEAPPEARSIVISLAARLSKMQERRSAHYIDEVTAVLWNLPKPAKPKRNHQS